MSVAHRPAKCHPVAWPHVGVRWGGRRRTSNASTDEPRPTSRASRVSRRLATRARAGSRGGVLVARRVRYGLVRRSRKTKYPLHRQSPPRRTAGASRWATLRKPSSSPISECQRGARRPMAHGGAPWAPVGSERPSITTTRTPSAAVTQIPVTLLVTERDHGRALPHLRPRLASAW